MSRLGSVPVGGPHPTRIMGVINSSPESFYKGSVRTTIHQIAQKASQMDLDGADFIDVGGMSSAPYLGTAITEREESRRVVRAIRTIQRVSNLPISVDTCRAGVARDALELGVEILNDVTGLRYDAAMPDVVRKFAPSLVLCAYDTKPSSGGPHQTGALLQKSVRIARSAGVSSNAMAVDPAIGFFRRYGRGRLFTRTNTDWVRRDLDVLRHLRKMSRGLPVLVSVSRKSFIGSVLNQKDPTDRLAGSLACEAFAVMCGAGIIRTHDVRESARVASETDRARGRRSYL